MSNEGEVNNLWDKQEYNRINIPINKPDRIIRENEKCTCMIINDTILGECVIFTFSVKGIKHHSNAEKCSVMSY
jgi:hypothetical protein